ncbi:hypothetical protein BJ742DRAFT_816702 [Cladochytrium replicatum]|nr:hypothetical protein BJ742DRAFT_816702 [Cladochytrium replicatum]
MLGSRFCLHVRGDTSTSRRLFDAVAAGCIPIIIANDIDNHLPFPLDVPYPAFVKRVDERLEVKGMEEALRRIWNETTESELVEMQKMLLEVREKLVYGFGDPFGNKSLGRWES